MASKSSKDGFKGQNAPAAAFESHSGVSGHVNSRSTASSIQLPASKRAKKSHSGSDAPEIPVIDATDPNAGEAMNSIPQDVGNQEKPVNASVTS
jgi:hypothetical protein